jgi:hypothetical protein
VECADLGGYIVAWDDDQVSAEQIREHFLLLGEHAAGLGRRVLCP